MYMTFEWWMDNNEDCQNNLPLSSRQQGAWRRCHSLSLFLGTGKCSKWWIHLVALFSTSQTRFTTSLKLLGHGVSEPWMGWKEFGACKLVNALWWAGEFLTGPLQVIGLEVCCFAQLMLPSTIIGRSCPSCEGWKLRILAVGFLFLLVAVA